MASCPDGPPPLVWRDEIRILCCRAQGDRLHAGASLGRGSVAQGRVQALPIVKDFDVLEHRRPRLGAGAEPGLMDPLCFERGKEALHGRIILSPIRFPCSPEWWRSNEALQAEAQAPQAPREQRHQAAGNIPALRSSGL